MDFLEISIPLDSALQEAVCAELDFLDFNSFLETEDTLLAYIEEDKLNESALKEVLENYQSKVTFTVAKQEKKNWNEEWEKNFEQTEINDRCLIRASFHKPEKNYEYEIIINPQMSFGTGHHSTTSMVVDFELEIDFKGKTVLDVGCGTSILSIMALKRGAKEVIACDIDDWCIENSFQNIKLNDLKNIEVLKGGIIEIQHPHSNYEIILANINKNVILEDLVSYSRYMSENGYLVLSGFYENDVQDIVEEAGKHGLNLKATKTKNNWASLLLRK